MKQVPAECHSDCCHCRRNLQLLIGYADDDTNPHIVTMLHQSDSETSQKLSQSLLEKDSMRQELDASKSTYVATSWLALQLPTFASNSKLLQRISDADARVLLLEGEVKHLTEQVQLLQHEVDAEQVRMPRTCAMT